MTYAAYNGLLTAPQAIALDHFADDIIDEQDLLKAFEPLERREALRVARAEQALRREAARRIESAAANNGGLQPGPRALAPFVVRPPVTPR